MNPLLWVGLGVLVADLVVLIVALAAIGGRSDARLEALVVRRWLASKPAAGEAAREETATFAPVERAAASGAQSSASMPRK